MRSIVILLVISYIICGLSSCQKNSDAISEPDYPVRIKCMVRKNARTNNDSTIYSYDAMGKIESRTTYGRDPLNPSQYSPGIVFAYKYSNGLVVRGTMNQTSGFTENYYFFLSANDEIRKSVKLFDGTVTTYFYDNEKRISSRINEVLLRDASWNVIGKEQDTTYFTYNSDGDLISTQGGDFLNRNDSKDATYEYDVAKTAQEADYLSARQLTSDGMYPKRLSRHLITAIHTYYDRYFIYDFDSKGRIIKMGITDVPGGTPDVYHEYYYH